MTWRIEQHDAAITQVGAVQVGIAGICLPVMSELLRQRQLHALVAGAADVLRLFAGGAATARGRHDGRLYQVAHTAVEHGGLSCRARPGLPGDTHFEMIGRFGPEIGIGQRSAHAGGVAVLDGGKACPVREGHVHFIALRRETPAQPGPSIGGAGRTRGPLPDPFGIALLVAGSQRQMQPVGEREGVFGHQRGGHVAVVTAGVVVGVGLVVRGQAQVVPFPAGVGPF